MKWLIPITVVGISAVVGVFLFSSKPEDPYLVANENTLTGLDAYQEETTELAVDTGLSVSQISGLGWGAQ